MIRTVKTFFAFFLLFSLHRFLAWSSLAAQFSSAADSYWHDYLVGLLSDIWMSALLTLPFWPFDFFSRRKIRFYHRVFNGLWLAVFGVFTAAHQGYVEYFKFQVIPFHLTYITDTSFLSSNGGTLFGLNSAFILILTAILISWSHKASKEKNKLIVGKWLLAVLVLATCSHVVNIKWRVNWLVVEPLQMNYIESLAASLRKKPTIIPNSLEDLAKFRELTDQPSPLSIVQSPHSKSMLAIENEIAKLRVKNKPLIIGVIIAESLREIDTGERDSDNQSITPNLDSLQNLGVKFTQAYSTGSVTRGGQEAIWCGTPSATDTSLMRSFPTFKFKCLPAMIGSQSAFETFWIHGGDTKFDSQLSFWKGQGVKNFLTQSDFNSDVPSTGWGYSDLAVFDRSANLLEDFSKKSSQPIMLPMILSVSNHIPWSLPSDASIDAKAFVASHPSFKTIKYFDESLDLFVGSLKEKNLWDRSIFIVVGDHGNVEEPWRPNFENDKVKYERMLSHITLSLTGGIIERLRSQQFIPATFDSYTSQSQIAPFLEQLAMTAALVDAKKFTSPSPMDAPLFEKSKWPIVSDLNQYLFLPEIGVKLPKEKVLAGQIPDESKAEWLAMIRYRAWLEALYARQK